MAPARCGPLRSTHAACRRICEHAWAHRAAPDGGSTALPPHTAIIRYSARVSGRWHTTGAHAAPSAFYHACRRLGWALQGCQALGCCACSIAAAGPLASPCVRIADGRGTAYGAQHEATAAWPPYMCHVRSACARRAPRTDCSATCAKTCADGCRISSTTGCQRRDQCLLPKSHVEALTHFTCWAATGAHAHTPAGAGGQVHRITHWGGPGGPRQRLGGGQPRVNSNCRDAQPRGAVSASRAAAGSFYYHTSTSRPPPPPRG